MDSHSHHVNESDWSIVSRLTVSYISSFGDVGKKLSVWWWTLMNRPVANGSCVITFHSNPSLFLFICDRLATFFLSEGHYLGSQTCEGFTQHLRFGWVVGILLYLCLTSISYLDSFIGMRLMIPHFGTYVFSHKEKTRKLLLLQITYFLFSSYFLRNKIVMIDP